MSNIWSDFALSDWICHTGFSPGTDIVICMCNKFVSRFLVSKDMQG